MSSPLIPGCPWYDLNLNYPPNVSWCEEKICSFVVTPFNAWSNLAYIVVGYLMWRKAKDSSSEVVRFFSIASILVGITSFAFHMSLNYFTQVFDYFGMYLFCVLMLMSNLSRMGRWAKGTKGFRQFWLSVVGLTVITCISVLIHFPIQLYVLFLIIAIIRTELVQKVSDRKYFWISLISLIFAAVLSALDVTHVLCWPENHWFQAHGTWHVISSIALYFAFLHAKKFAVTDQTQQ